MSLYRYDNVIVHKKQYKRRYHPYPFLSVPVEAAGPAARICKRCLTLNVSRLTQKDARCWASAFEHNKPEAGKGSPPGSPYTVSVELMTTTKFSAGSTTTFSNRSNKQHPIPTL